MIEMGQGRRPGRDKMNEVVVEVGKADLGASAKINISYSILFNLTTSYSSYFWGKKGISRNKTSFFLLMLLRHSARLSIASRQLSLPGKAQESCPIRRPGRRWCSRWASGICVPENSYCPPISLRSTG